MSDQPRLRDLPKGVTRTSSGHLRYYSPKELRGKYVHREMVERLIDETHPLTRQLLPWPYEVHHMDYNKEHNDPLNFLLLPPEFHSVLTADRKRDGVNGRFHPKWGKPPKWLPLFDGIDQLGEVSF